MKVNEKKRVFLSANSLSDNLHSVLESLDAL